MIFLSSVDRALDRCGVSLVSRIRLSDALSALWKDEVLSCISCDFRVPWCILRGSEFNETLIILSTIIVRALHSLGSCLWSRQMLSWCSLSMDCPYYHL